ncbi:hypothetical protein COLO4_34476 [Corchorus olitorius]|uniref:Uncharacterized protein n=1 Tax=Corchorus olitorius TaxID=93759 RepID=A0A1R3GKK5_9ROSI|nr:hypothetical protein COLO4_34476 [Corchorus olitorius]
MGDQLGFQQRWEYRKTDNDLDSSCDDSKSSNDPLHKRHNLVSSLVSVGDDETSESIRLKQKDNDNTAGTEGLQQINVGKAKKRRKTKNVSNDSRKTRRKKKDSPQEVVDLQKGETNAPGSAAPIDEVKTFMETLLEELRVTRENLVKEMMEELQKIGAYDTTTLELNRRKRRHRKEEVQDQHEKNPKDQSTQFQNPNSFEESIQVQNFLAQQQNNFQGNSNLQEQNNFGYGMRIQNCSNKSSIGHAKSNDADHSAYYFDALKVTEPITLSKKNQVEGQKTVVLAIEAPKSKGRSSKRSVKGKKTVNCSNQYQGPENQARTEVASDKSNGEKLGSSNILPSFLSSSSFQAPSSMYLTLPTVLTEPLVPNHGLNDHASLCNYVPQRVAEKKRDHVNPLMMEPNCNQGSFPVIQQPEERIRSFGLVGSRNIAGNNISQNSTLSSSGIGSGFPVPFYQGMDFTVGSSIPKPVTSELYRGATSFLPGGSYNLSEHLAANNNHHMHSAYKSGGSGRLMSYQYQNVKDSHFFPQ